MNRSKSQKQSCSSGFDGARVLDVADYCCAQRHQYARADQLLSRDLGVCLLEVELSLAKEVASRASSIVFPLKFWPEPLKAQRGECLPSR